MLKKIIKKRQFLYIFVLLLFFVSMMNTTLTIKADTKDTPSTGDFVHYNGIIFDYFEAQQADIEGALAVGGEAWFGTRGQFDIGSANGQTGSSTVLIGQYQNPNGYPSLLLNSLPQVGNDIDSYVNVRGGAIAMNEKFEERYWNLNNHFWGEIFFLEEAIIDNAFSDFKSSALHITQVLDASQQRIEGSIRLNQFIGWEASAAIQAHQNFIPDNLNLNDTGIDSIVVLNIIDEGHITINTPQITSAYEQYDLIVFNFPNATSVEMTGGSIHVNGNQINTSAPGGVWPDQNALLKKYAEKIIWNFPKADTLHIYAHGVVGSIMAPQTRVSTNGGSIDGMLVANSFLQANGHELHAFSMSRAPLGFENLKDEDITEELPIIDPVIPDEPDEPNEPIEPVEPNEPDVPTEPIEPVEPNEPDEPTVPIEPVEPNEPDEPTEPIEPVEPNEPDEPVEPNEPDEPTEPIEPVEPYEPDEPTVPIEPVEPNEPDEPIEPIEPNEPDEPVEPNEPDVPTLPIEPVEPNEPDIPTEPVEPNEPDEPNDLIKPVEPNEPDEPTEPVESNEPNEPTESVEPNEPDVPTEPVEPNELVEPTDPIEPVEPNEPDEPLVPIEPVEPTDPDEPTVPKKPNTLFIQTPNTGNATNLFFFYNITFLSLSTIIFIIKKKRL